MHGKRKYVNERDLRILKMCLEQKFMTLKQVGRMFFKESKNVQKVPLRRLNILMKRGFLKSVRPVIGGEAVYLTAEKGVKILQEHNLSGNLRALPGIDYKTFEHDRLVTDVAITFRGYERYKWICERKLRQKKPKTKVPDAIVYHEGDKFLIEVERTLKKNSYYERVFESLSFDYPDVEAVLYFTDGFPMMKHLQKLADGCKQIYFCTIKDFLEDECEAGFQNLKYDTLILQCYRFSHPNKKNMDESLWDHWSEEFPEEVQERKSA